MCDIGTVECIVSKKIEGQRNKQTDKPTETITHSRRATITNKKQTNQHRRKAYSRRATKTNKQDKICDCMRQNHSHVAIFYMELNKPVIRPHPVLQISEN